MTQSSLQPELGQGQQKGRSLARSAWTGRPDERNDPLTRPEKYTLAFAGGVWRVAGFAPGNRISSADAAEVNQILIRTDPEWVSDGMTSPLILLAGLPAVEPGVNGLSVTCEINKGENFG